MTWARRVVFARIAMGEGEGRMNELNGEGVMDGGAWMAVRNAQDGDEDC
jgi:hypothetical protein